MRMIGHNGGPTLERGKRWRAYQWRQAQKALMPRSLPMAVIRMRVRRAAELGMDYKAYAAIRQATGRDICGLLFSSNALSILAGPSAMPADRQARLDHIAGAQRLGALHAPLDLAEVLAGTPLDAVIRAPDLRQSWSQTGQQMRQFLSERRLVGDQVIVVGETALEAEWTAAARAAGYLPAARYFQNAT
jgi:hypothetical protein